MDRTQCRNSLFAPRMAGMMIAAAGSLAGVGSAGAALITDAGFFSGIPTTVINFETDGAGNPITLIQGQRQVMPSDAYSPQGVTFVGTSGPVQWVNDGNSAFDAAQAIGGSPMISIPSSLCNQFTMSFSVPVRAFGFFVVNNRTADPIGPSFVARDSQGNILDTANWDAKFVDGTITTPTTTADYGFVGITTSELIASVTVTKQAAIMDDLRFSPVPGPGALALSAVAGLVGLRRRR
jgi:MYXO-CTERM domain-containing protein